MIWHCQEDIISVIFVIMLKIVEGERKVAYISIDFKGL